MYEKEQLIKKLYEIGCIKFGDFMLSTREKSPYYIDLRILPSFPLILEEVSRVFGELITETQGYPDRICGIAYAGVPIAVATSLKTGIPAIYTRRDGSKDYGMKRLVEGVMSDGDDVYLLDDVISTGRSKLNAIQNILKDV